MEYKISLMKNAFYAQSGGVTSVINCSAYGLFNGFKKHFSNSNIFVGKNGIVGLIEDEIYDLNKTCLLYTSPSPRDLSSSRMPSSA